MGTGVTAHADRPVRQPRAGDDAGDQVQHVRVGGQLRPGPGIGPVQVEYLGGQVVGTNGKEVRDRGQLVDRGDRRDRLHHRADRDRRRPQFADRRPDRPQVGGRGDHRHHDADVHPAPGVQDRPKLRGERVPVVQ